MIRALLLTLLLLPASLAINTTGIMQHWTFNDVDVSGSDLFDVSGNNYDGSIGAGVTTGATGVIQQAFDFPGGANNGVQSVNWSALGVGTISFWFNPDASCTAGSCGQNDIASRGADAYDELIYGDGVGVSGGATMVWQTAGGSWVTYIQKSFTASTWYHVAIVWNTTSTQYDFYVDSARQTTLSDLSGHAKHRVGWNYTIGERQGTGVAEYEGLLDDWCLWNRSITPAEVQLLYSGGSGQDCESQTTLVITNDLPEDEAHSNDQPQVFVFNITGLQGEGNFTLYLNDTNSSENYFIPGNGSLENITSNGSHSFSVFLNETGYDWYVNGTDRGFTSTTSSIRRLLMDFTTPIITVNTGNFFETDNSTVLDKFVTTSVNYDLTVSDRYVFAYNVTITAANGTRMDSIQQVNVGNQDVNITDAVDMTDWLTGRYNVTIYAEDDHTAKRIPEYRVDTSNRGLTFTTPSNVITIQSPGAPFLSSEAFKEVDRYTWDFTESSPRQDWAIILTCDDTLYHRGDLWPFPSFVCGNHWIDFNLEGVKGQTYNVVKMGLGYLVNIHLSAGRSDLSFQSIGGLNNVTKRYNFSLSYVTDLTAEYSNYTTIAGTPYARSLIYNLNYTCAAAVPSTIVRYIDGTADSSFSGTCDGTEQSVTNSYVHSVETQYQIYFKLDASILPAAYNRTSQEINITEDLYDPTAEVSISSVSGGFNSTNVNVSLFCNDTLFSPLIYNSTFNGVNLAYYNHSAGTTITNETSVSDGNNTLVGVCSDLFSSTTATLTQLYYSKELCLVDERTGNPFDVDNVTRARAYYDDNSTYFDYKSFNVTCANITSADDVKLRIDIGYSDGTTINRWIDITLPPEDEVKICANPEDVSHYEQLIVSTAQKPVLLKSVFADCYVAADYTRFAYQSAYLLKAYTIEVLYYLTTFTGGVENMLASVDGSVATFINIDTLEFQQQGYDLRITADGLSFEQIDENQTMIHYENFEEDNTMVRLVIQEVASGTIYLNTTSFSNPNEFNVTFNHAAVNATPETLFLAWVTRTNDEGEEFSLKMYFGPGGEFGRWSTGFAIGISLLIWIFGLTFVSSRLTFSWFGILIIVASVAVLSLGVPMWYLIFVGVLEVISLIYVAILLSKQTYGALT